jgi:hypothetical protein
LELKLTRAHQGAFKIGRLRYDPEPLSAQEVIDWINHQVPTKIETLGNISAEAMSGLRVNAWFNESIGTMTVHVLNYNVPLGVSNGGQVQPLPNVQVSVRVPVQMKVNVVRLYSPETNSPLPVVPFPEVPFQPDNQHPLVTFEIPNLNIYTMAVIQ